MKINANILFKIFPLVVLILVSHVNNASFGLLKKYNKKIREESNITGEPDAKRQKDIEDKPIYNQGWAKYLHFTDADSNKPKAFFKNTKFQIEQTSNNNGFPNTVDNVLLIIKILLFLFYCL